MVLTVDDQPPNGSSSPTADSNDSLELKKSGQMYSYSRVVTSPLLICVQEMDETTQSADSLISHTESLTANQSSDMGFSTLPKVTDLYKLYKVQHEGDSYFIHAQSDGSAAEVPAEAASLVSYCLTCGMSKC